MVRGIANGCIRQVILLCCLLLEACRQQSNRFQLYVPTHIGGLWIGKYYGGGADWQWDPLHQISHGATAMQTARFYYLAVTGRLVAPELRDDFWRALSDTAIDSKFVKGLEQADIYRKSGTSAQGQGVMAERFLKCDPNDFVIKQPLLTEEFFSRVIASGSPLSPGPRCCTRPWR